MILTEENGNTSHKKKKPVLVPLCPLQILPGQARGQLTSHQSHSTAFEVQISFNKYQVPKAQ
jgi:hypothetical protein